MKRTIRLVPATMLIVAALLFASSAVQTAQAHPSSFPDVSETHPAHDAIESLAARGVITGTDAGLFLPNDSLTRGQAAKMLVGWRTPQVTVTQDVAFPDVDDTFASYVARASAAGWVKGYPDGTFRSHVPLTRGQMAMVTVRALGLEEQALQLSEKQVALILTRFADEGAIPVEARQHVALAVGCGLFQGDDGFLNPWRVMTRSQFAMVLSRADALVARLAAGGAAMTLVDDASTGVLADVEGDGGTRVDEEDARDSGSGYTEEERALAAFMDECLFRPHRSAVTGEMVLQNAEWYGIPPLSQLVIMGAETSLGDPQLGGTLARRNNFGCLRYHGADTPWGSLADGRIWVAGYDWYSFPTPDIGMAAFGRYLKVGANGFYFPILTGPTPDWHRFAVVYYGSGVSGFSSYVSRLQSLERSFRAAAARYGVSF